MSKDYFSARVAARRVLPCARQILPGIGPAFTWD
jgi:hypothetical protein